VSGRYFVDSKKIDCEIKIFDNSYKNSIECDDLRIGNTYFLGVDNNLCYNNNKISEIKNNYESNEFMIIFSIIYILMLSCVFIFLVIEGYKKYSYDIKNYFRHLFNQQDKYKKLNEHDSNIQENKLTNSTNNNINSNMNKLKNYTGAHTINQIHNSIVNQSDLIENTDLDKNKYTNDIENTIHQKEIELESY
jgi:hypothetical protein